MIPSKQPRAELRTLLYLFLFALAVLMLCTTTSPIYNGHDWTDTNTYLTMGRGILNGKVPYRDLFDHKGPLLYFLFALAALVSPGGFGGVFALQVVSLTATLYFLFRTARVLGLSPCRSLFSALSVPVFLLSAGIYYLPKNLDYGGGSAEELCLPFLTLAVYLITSGCVTDRFSAGQLLLLGACAGCVVQIKFNLALFFFGLAAPVFLAMPLRKQFRRFFTQAGLVVLGGLISFVPYLLYALCTGSLDDCIYAYFTFNRSYAAGNSGLMGMLRLTAHQLKNTLRDNSAFRLTLLWATLGLVFARAPWTWRLGVLFSALALGFAVFCGRLMPYTLLPLLLFAHVGSLALLGRLPKMAEGRGSRAAAFLLALLLLAATVGRNQVCLHKPLRWSEEETCQQEIARLIRSGPYEAPTLLEAGMLNRGFYNQLNMIPTMRYFYLPNVTYESHPEILDSQLALIQSAAVDYVVIQSNLEDLSADSLPAAEIQKQMCLAALDRYTLVKRVTGTGAVDHLYYYLFVRT